ncbi:MAG TPA: hypothetical protein VH374_16775 [Polyangia bacterium]|jgi:hypothetical protein|nr:hypothetical protein [Polyangia bacterium]
MRKNVQNASMNGRLMMAAVLVCCLGGLLACGADSGAGPGGSAGGAGMQPGGTGGTSNNGGGTGGVAEPGGMIGGEGDTGKGGTSGKNVDDGSLFKDAGSVSSILADAGGPNATPDAGASTMKEVGASAIPGDGNMATGKIGGFGLKAIFTQQGLDVTVAITATNCPQGMHTFTIHEGFACDDPTKGPVWGSGKRGGGIPALVCDSTKHGTLTYTRTGTDPSMNWTVADHNQTTDLTLHPLMADTQCGTFF